MSHVCGHGLALDVPRGWDASITRRDACTLPVLHAATVPLPAHRADSGGDVIERLGWGDVFVSLIEHDGASARTALFSARGLPLPLMPHAFVQGALQGMRPVQSGAQRFFTEHGRAFCLFVVVGDHARRARLLREVNRVLATLRVEAGSGAEGGHRR